MAERQTTIWYGRADHGYTQRYDLTVEGRYDLTDDFDLASLAEKAARDYHWNHDGWEAAWPITFAISATEDGPELAQFTIDRDVEPVFSATRIKPAAGVKEGGK